MVVSVMGEKIDFPKNYDLYLKKAMSNFKIGNMEEAIPYFAKAYQLKKEDKINTFYTTALYQIGSYQEAKVLAEEKLAFYQNEEKLYAFYTSILIKAHYFAEATDIIKREQHKIGQPTNREVWKTLAKNCIEEKENKSLQEEKKHKNLLKQSFSIGDKAYPEQTALMQELEQVPNDIYLQAAKIMLVNPFVNGLIKATLIEGLIAIECSETIELSWFDQNREIIPTHLKRLEENQTVETVKKIIEEQVAIHNPSLFQLINEEANLHFILLYPFIEEVITVPTVWVKLYQQKYDTEKSITIEDSAEQKKMIKWMDQLNQQLLELF